MQLTTGSHWFGVVLIFIAALLLTIASITTPVIDDLPLFSMVIGPHAREDFNLSAEYNPITIRWGTFGGCYFVNNTAKCLDVRVGYPICELAYNATKQDPSNAKCDAADTLTHAMVLHPVASAVAFIAAFIAMAAGFAGSLIGGCTAILAWIFSVIAVGIDFTIFGIVKKRLDDYNDNNELHGYDLWESTFGPALWCVVVAFVFLTVGTPIVLFTSFRVRRAEKRTAPRQSYSHASATTEGKDNVYRA